MAVELRDVAIPCEYVYETEKKAIEKWLWPELVYVLNHWQPMAQNTPNGLFFGPLAEWSKKQTILG